MIRDITIGQYYQGESLIHKLDPRMKVVGVLVYLISLFCFRYVIGFLVAGLFFALVLKLSKDHRILAVDIDYHAKSADGCHGAFTGTVKAFWGTGT